MLKKPGLALVTLALCMYSSMTFAQERDVAGSKDHPLMSRATGYYINRYDTQAYGVGSLTTSANCEKPCTHPAIKDRQLVAEGKVTEINYRVQTPDKDPGSVAVFRNYENAVANLGGVKISNGGFSNGLVTGGHVYAIPSIKGDAKSPPVIFAVEVFGGSYSLVFVEPKALAQTVTVGELAKELSAKGFITLYINFATGKSDVPQDVMPKLAEVAKLMAGDPKLVLSIEGHTDNVGNAKDNEKLSASRAQNVMQSIAQQAGDAKRLKSKGLGAAVPVADNRTEDGRAKNRRVELVKQ